MADQSHSEDEAILVLDVPEDSRLWPDFIKTKRLRVIQQLAQQSRKGALDQSLAEQLTLLLEWLDNEVQMTPQLRVFTKIDEGVKLIFERPEFDFPEHAVTRAQQLYVRWVEENWGAKEVADDAGEADVSLEGPEGNDSGNEGSSRNRRTATPAPATSNRNEEPSFSTVRVPRKDHPIYGLNGIMHGILIKRGKRKSEILDRRYLQRSAKVYGHNGLQIGAWFATRLVALFRGAHGSTQAGIAGNQDDGAYSIVVAGFYDQLDEDRGHAIFYSGSGSHDNTDPRQPAPSTAGTLALQASIAHGRPVRVIRASSGRSQWAPTRGCRYDGLYKVVAALHARNQKGGLYEQFKLVRLEDQDPIVTTRPTPAEIRDFETIKDGY